jgi:hypothetical protein
MEQDQETFLRFFNLNACISKDNTDFRFTSEDIIPLFSPLNYWHTTGQPSSWLCAGLVTVAYKKFGTVLSYDEQIQLCSMCLGISPSKLQSTLEWNEQYIAWHDGDLPH